VLCRRGGRWPVPRIGPCQVVQQQVVQQPGRVERGEQQRRSGTGRPPPRRGTHRGCPRTRLAAAGGPTTGSSTTRPVRERGGRDHPRWLAVICPLGQPDRWTGPASYRRLRRRCSRASGHPTASPRSNVPPARRVDQCHGRIGTAPPTCPLSSAGRAESGARKNRHRTSPPHNITRIAGERRGCAWSGQSPTRSVDPVSHELAAADSNARRGSRVGTVPGAFRVPAVKPAPSPASRPALSAPGRSIDMRSSSHIYSTAATVGTGVPR
jgi:hypothetical protein